MKKILIFNFFLFLLSCSNLEFIYSENTKTLNPLYEKTKVNVFGLDEISINSYIANFFGKYNEQEFTLDIQIKEKKTKRSVETNQAASNIRHELRFTYILFSEENNCLIYEKDIVSRFSIIPKSSGYNYGSDTSLEKKYELAINQSLNQFLSSLSEINIESCL